MILHLNFGIFIYNFKYFISSIFLIYIKISKNHTFNEYLPIKVI